MTQRVLFLDDSTERLELARAAFECTTVDTAARAIAELRRVHELGEAFDVVYLDHDLGDQFMIAAGTPGHGGDVVDWIVQHEPRIELVVIHSMNAPAAERMHASLTRAGYSARRVPFTMLVASWRAAGGG